MRARVDARPQRPAARTDTIEIPYSTLKQHIAKGDVREVRMSATEVRALPTESARQAGAPAMWVATPVPNDEIVPLLESKNITYQGIKSDESHVVAHSRHHRRAHVRHHPRHVVQAHEPREIDDGADARPAPRATRTGARTPVSIRSRASTRRRKSSRRS